MDKAVVQTEKEENVALTEQNEVAVTMCSSEPTMQAHVEDHKIIEPGFHLLYGLRAAAGVDVGRSDLSTNLHMQLLEYIIWL